MKHRTCFAIASFIYQIGRDFTCLMDSQALHHIHFMILMCLSTIQLNSLNVEVTHTCLQCSIVNPIRFKIHQLDLVQRYPQKTFFLYLWPFFHHCLSEFPHTPVEYRFHIKQSNLIFITIADR